MPQRHCTRANIEAEFTKRFGTLAGQTWQVQEVLLLPELSPPTWLLRYTISYQGRSGVGYHDLLFVEKAHIAGRPYLNGPLPVLLPEGCTTVQEEDAEIERRDAVERERRRAQTSTDHQQ
jgi:hypothetical protein